MDLAYRFVQNIAIEDRQVSGTTLQEIQENLEFQGEVLRTSLQMEHDDYDNRTGHGATQVAVLRP